MWSLFHYQNPKDSVFDTFPHKELMKAPGAAPPKFILDELGPDGVFITNKKVCAFKNLCRFALSDLDATAVPVKGACWTPYKLDTFLKEHCVVACDKDGDHVTISPDAYCLEPRAHMEGLHTCGQPVYEELSLPSLNSQQHWIEQGRVWMKAARLLVLRTVPDPLYKPTMTFMDAFAVRKLPVFYLLAKSHKGTTIVDNRWPKACRRACRAGPLLLAQYYF